MGIQPLPPKDRQRSCRRRNVQDYCSTIRSEAYNFIGKHFDYDDVFLCFRAAVIVPNAYAFQLCK